MDHERYRAQLDEALAVDDLVSTPFIVTISAIVGEHRLGGDFGVRLRKLHDAYCKSEIDDAGMRAELVKLRDVGADELEAAAAAKRLHAIEGRLDPSLAAMHLSMCREPAPKPDYTQPGWTALYGPAYLLGWSDMLGAARRLFTMPLRLKADATPADLREAAADALKAGRRNYETLDVDLDGLDTSSVDAFRWSWCHALYVAAAAFDPELKGAPKKPKKPKKPPEMGPNEEKLVEKSLAAITKWAKQNPGAELAQFGFDGTPPYDNVGICFDTAESFATTCRSVDADTLASRRKLEYGHLDHTRDHADAWLAHHDVAHMSDHYFAEMKLDAKYTKFAASADAPTGKDGQSWGEAVQRILFVRVLDRLADQGAFDAVKRGSPLHLVYTLHDDAPVLVRTL